MEAYIVKEFKKAFYETVEDLKISRVHDIRLDDCVLDLLDLLPDWGKSLGYGIPSKIFLALERELIGGFNKFKISLFVKLNSSVPPQVKKIRRLKRTSSL